MLHSLQENRFPDHSYAEHSTSPDVVSWEIRWKSWLLRNSSGVIAQLISKVDPYRPGNISADICLKHEESAWFNQRLCHTR